MDNLVKLCQSEQENRCFNPALGLCYHCSRNLCIDHLSEHAQLLDALTRSILDEHFQILTELSSRINSLMISSKILNQPFIQLEQWRQQAYQQIDEIVQNKFDEIRTKIEQYQSIFDSRKNEQLEKIVRYKQKISELFRQNQVAQRDLLNLKKSIDKLQNQLNLFDQHSIELISNRSLMHSIHIQLKFDPWKSSISPTTSSASISSIIQQLEFRLKFVRQSGLVTSHSILVPVHGTIGDLIEQFSRNEEMKENCLAIEICQYRVRRRLKNDVQLKTIFNQISELILYETSNRNSSEDFCSILCRFENGLPWDILFRLPILLDVPRIHCRGKDILNVLNQTLNNSFPLLIQMIDVDYEVKIVADDDEITPPTILNQWTEEIIDDHLLMDENATLIVNLVYRNRSNVVDQRKHLARLDGILKTNEKRRKSRK